MVKTIKGTTINSFLAITSFLLLLNLNPSYSFACGFDVLIIPAAIDYLVQYYIHI